MSAQQAQAEAGYTVYRRRIAEDRLPGRPLGRHVHHDSRSLAYLVSPAGAAVSKRWERLTPVLDQGNVGSCTGNAACGVLGTVPFWPAVGGKLPHGPDEDEALALYGAATVLDTYPGKYPPDDTGSDGLAVAKACKAAGLISGYLHITSLAAAQAAIQTGPFIIGADWYEGMDTPDSAGLVAATGKVRGGHEYECVGYDAANDLWELVNSWGTGYGLGGHFFYSSATFAALLAAQGDATVFVPAWQPAPTPTPVPPVPPGAAPFPGADPAVAARLVALAGRRAITMTDYLNAHFRRYFHL